MKIKYIDGKNVDVRMSPEELNTLRYMVSESVERLESTTRFYKRMAKADPNFKAQLPSAREISKNARKLTNDIEKAMETWMSHLLPKKRT